VNYLVNSIGLVQLNVNDLEAMIAESTQILGLQLRHRDEKMAWLS